MSNYSKITKNSPVYKNKSLNIAVTVVFVVAFFAEMEVNCLSNHKKYRLLKSFGAWESFESQYNYYMYLLVNTTIVLL